MLVFYLIWRPQKRKEVAALYNYGVSRNYDMSVHKLGQP